MKIFGIEFGNKELKAVNKRLDKIEKTKSFISANTGFGTNYVGSRLSLCGDVMINLQSFYNLLKQNNEAMSYKEKIVQMVGQKGIYLEDAGGNKIKDGEQYQSVVDTFAIPTFKAFKDQYFIQRFCSGEVTIYPRMNGLAEVQAQILDTRTISKQFDKFGNIVKIIQNEGNKDIKQEWKISELYHTILLQDVNRAGYGMSYFNGVIMDALSDYESSSRQLHFFINNGMPTSLIMLDDDALGTDEEVQNVVDQLKSQYQGSDKAHKTMVANGIKDIKVLDVSNKDLDLLNLRKFAIQKMAMVFQIDPRLIGYKDGSSGNNAEIIEIKKEASDTVRAYGQELEDNMNAFYTKFVDPTFDKRIKLKSDTFQDDVVIFNQCLDAVKTGCINRIEFREKTGFSIDKATGISYRDAELPEDLEMFTVMGLTNKITALADEQGESNNMNTTPNT